MMLESGKSRSPHMSSASEDKGKNNINYREAFQVLVMLFSPAERASSCLPFVP